MPKLHCKVKEQFGQPVASVSCFMMTWASQSNRADTGSLIIHYVDQKFWNKEFMGKIRIARGLLDAIVPLQLQPDSRFDVVTSNTAQLSGIYAKYHDKSQEHQSTFTNEEANSSKLAVITSV